jgi:hypothetical protein
MRWTYVITNYDKAFKLLVDLSPLDWALFTGLDKVGKADGMETELPERNRYVDRLIRVSDDHVELAVHLEFQAGKSGNRVPLRLLDYSIGVTQRYRLPVHSCVVLLCKPADSPVLTGEFMYGLPNMLPYLTFRYRVIRLWKVPLATFLNPGSSLAAAGVLSDFGNLPAKEVGTLVTACIESIQDADTRHLVLTIAYNLAGLRFNDGKADIMFERNLEVLERSSTIQAAIRRGEARLLLTSAEQVFGAPSQDILDKVRNAKSKKLVEWNLRIGKAQSWAELVTD